MLISMLGVKIITTAKHSSSVRNAFRI
jgi:hypothetical protein